MMKNFQMINLLKQNLRPDKIIYLN